MNKKATVVVIVVAMALLLPTIAIWVYKIDRYEEGYAIGYSIGALDKNFRDWGGGIFIDDDEFKAGYWAGMHNYQEEFMMGFEDGVHFETKCIAEYNCSIYGDIYVHRCYEDADEFYLANATLAYTDGFLAAMDELMEKEVFLKESVNCGIKCKFKVGDQVVVPIPRTVNGTEPIIGDVTDITLSCEMLVEDTKTGEDMWFSQDYCFPYDSQKRYFVMPVDLDNETRMMFFVANASEISDIELAELAEAVEVKVVER